MNQDIAILRELARQVREIAEKPIQEERRIAWSKHNSFQGDQPLIYIRAYAFDEIFDESKLQCQDPFFRQYEKKMYDTIYRDQFGDDYIIEPWITVGSIYKPSAEYRWGLPVTLGEKPSTGGAAAYAPSLEDEADFEKLTVPTHCIDEEKTREQYEKLGDAINDILTVNLDRGPMLFMWTGDIATDLAKLRGLEQIMWDAYDRPEFLHKLASFMSKAILKVHHEAVEQGDLGLANSENQCLPYALEVKRPQANAYGANPKDIWGYMAAQEFTTFSAEMFDEFMLQYQIPILEEYGLAAYGCCEDLTGKIPYLKKIKNLRRIAVSPFANVKRCAEQIGSDYIVSYRPNPSSMVATGIDEEYIRKEMRTQFDVLKQNHCKFDITLKDVETVNRDPDAIKRWVSIVRSEIEAFSF